MNYDYDLIVVGGGPAGSTMSLYAAKQGLKVLLVDKEYFPRDKVGGDVIPRFCLSILEELHLIDVLLQEPHVREASIFFYSEHECLQFHPRAALATKRIIFDNVLFQAAKSCVDTRQGWKVESLLVQQNQVFGVQGTSNTGETFEYTAKVVAGADGYSSVVARAINLSQDNKQLMGVATRAYYRHMPSDSQQLELHYLQECIPGYFRIFPVDGETVNVGVLVFPDILKDRETSEAALECSLKLHHQLMQSPLIKNRFEGAELIGDIQSWYLPLASRRRTIHGNGFILAGDAAGLIDPLIGNGVDAAMLSGKIAGEILASICQSNNYSAEALQNYANQIWKHLGARYQSNLIFRQQLKSPPLTFPFRTRMDRLNSYFTGAGTVTKRTD